MISRELLSEVLKEDLHRIGRIDQVANCIHYKIYNDFLEDTYYAVNIYELAHKCKEWSLTKGYFIYSTNELAFIKTLSLETLDIVFSNGDMNESECTFKACEWIFEQGENK